MSNEAIFQLRKEADELLAAGKYKKAYQRYQDLREADPHNPEWAVRVGELAVSLGEVEEAVQAYRQAAEGYARHGHLLKAIAACKYVLDLDPSQTDTQTMLAELFARDSRDDDRVSALEPAPSRPASKARTSAAMPAVPPGPAPRSTARVSASMSAAAHAAPPPPLPPPSPSTPVVATPMAEVRRLRDELPGRPVRPVDGAEAEEVALELDEDLIIEEADASIIELESEQAAVLSGERPARVAPTPPPPPLPPADGQPVRTRSQALRLEVLPRVPLFSSLPQKALEALIGQLSVERHTPGDVVVREGEPGDALYVVVKGLCEVTRGGPSNVLARLGDGTFFGELALVTADPRTATVTVVEPTELLVVSRAVMNGLLQRYPEVLKTVLGFVRGRLVATVLATSPLFTAFDLDDRRALAAEFELREMDAGTLSVRQGQRADALQVILAGQVVVERDGKELARLGAGELFGELSLLGGEGTATIRAERRTWTLALPRARFQEVVLARPQILAYLAELADRRAAANRNGEPDSGRRLSLV